MAEAQHRTGPWTDVDARLYTPLQGRGQQQLCFACEDFLWECLLHGCCVPGAALGAWHEEGTGPEVLGFLGVRGGCRSAYAMPLLLFTRAWCF